MKNFFASRNNDILEKSEILKIIFFKCKFKALKKKFSNFFKNIARRYPKVYAEKKNWKIVILIDYNLQRKQKTGSGKRELYLTRPLYLVVNMGTFVQLLLSFCYFKSLFSFTKLLLHFVSFVSSRFALFRFAYFR